MTKCNYAIKCICANSQAALIRPSLFVKVGQIDMIFNNRNFSLEEIDMIRVSWNYLYIHLTCISRELINAAFPASLELSH
jgi:hypothetical protein